MKMQVPYCYFGASASALVAPVLAVKMPSAYRLSDAKLTSMAPLAPPFFALVILAMAWLASAPPIQAQGLSEGPLSHRQVMAVIALECVQTKVGPTAPLKLIGQGRAAIVSSDLEAGLIENDFQLTNSDSAARLSYSVDVANVELKRDGRSRLIRTVSLGMSFQLWSPPVDTSEEQGSPEVLMNDAGTCFDSKTDTVNRAIMSSLAYPGFPETNPVLPPKGGWRRFVEPAILIGATAVGTYLFFNLRSRRADSG